MLRFVLSAACLVAAVPAFAQASGAQTPQGPETQTPPALTGPQLAVQQSAMAFGQCIQAGVRGLAATVTPEAGATTVVGGCSTQKQALETAAASYIATLPADQQAGAQENLRTHLGGVEAQVAGAIRQMRAGAAAPAAAAH